MLWCERRIKKKEHVRLVIYKDKIIAEKYDTGFDKTVNLGWSMTKSITSGVWVLEQRKFDIDAPAPIPEWRKNDKRKSITTSDLLHMNLVYNGIEDYNTICDATKMLFFRGYDCAI
jgi:hypothetical protein